MRLILTLAWLGMMWPGQGFAAIAIKPTGEIARDYSSITLNVVVEGIKQATTEENGYAKRLEIFVNEVSGSQPVPFSFTDTTTSEVNLEASSDEEAELQTDTTQTVTFAITITETANDTIKEAVEKSSDKSSLTIKVTYKEEGQDKEDGSVTITRDASIANEAPSGVSASGTFRKIIAKWSVQSSIAFEGSRSSGKPSGMTMYVISKNLNGPVSLAAKIFNEDPDAEVEDAECSVDLDAADGESCVTCANAEGADENVYLDATAIKAAYAGKEEQLQVIETATNSGSLTSGQLPVDQDYVVFLTYRPDSLKRSICLTATATVDTTMGEYYGEEEAKEKDPRCFIASAAWGTPYHHEVSNFRWFRDKYLKRFAWGRRFVESYYRWSPPVARLIDAHPWLAATVRGILYIPSKVIEFFR